VQEAKITWNKAFQDEKLVIRENVNEINSLKRKATDIDKSETTAHKAASCVSEPYNQRLPKYLVWKVYKELTTLLRRLEKECTSFPNKTSTDNDRQTMKKKEDMVEWKS